tara:strand:- start:4459 stop:5121 length:663 start_codon:yes stop_codon:yes gene_type:complete
MVASGEISKESMKKAVFTFAGLAFISGLALIVYSIANYIMVLAFIALGLAAIWAAIKYTAGKNPYGYSGYGDMFVFIFFGLVGVLASSFLHTKDFSWLSILPAITIGAFSTAVLTLNNLRDIKNDALTGKNTTIVKMGFDKGKGYFAILLFVGIITLIAYAIISGFANRQYLFLLGMISIAGIIKRVLNTNTPAEIDPFLKKTAISTFLVSVLFFVAMFY